MNLEKKRHRRPIAAESDKFLDEGRELFALSYAKGNIDLAMVREALVKAKRALLLNPSNYDALVLMGSIYSDLEESDSYECALQAFDQAIQLEPDNYFAYSEKAGALLELNMPAEALAMAKKAITLASPDTEEPENAQFAYLHLIEALFANSLFTEARDAIRKAVQECPTELMSSQAEKWLNLIQETETKN